ncbi:MAG: hypothetical protein DRR16_15395 [Candidatus Parabeggiatoa sp. nov. 3]|nr:MAG: hypothetical protein DRR00_20655 [Gammaproteobacteria bacterium]RKZ54777.1 MAG: hypothetical protein DRQ99_30940 [Gammaproteobacteria bacterium]RKZ84192.1 MAG: hypothetical protein DRR16_15395 [Gammaproteobacteria bacterium]
MYLLRPNFRSKFILRPIFVQNLFSRRRIEVKYSSEIDNVLRKSFYREKILRKTLFLGMRPTETF